MKLNDYGYSGRLEVWNVALEEIKSSPLFVNGMTYDGLFIKDYAQYYVDQAQIGQEFGIIFEFTIKI